MKNLLVDINAIVDTSNNVIVFEKAVISNLYRIQKPGYSLSLIIDDTLLNQSSIQQAIDILNGEFQFEIINKPESITDYAYLIEKIEDQFIIKTKNETKACAGWNDIAGYIKSSARRIAHIRNTNETNIAIEMNLDGNGVYHVDTGLNFFNHMVEQLSKH